jgi:TonB system transport protein ExbD (group 1)
MAVSLGSGGPIKRHAYQQNAEMNITPFVDVMLVLLIIFMVAAPLATVSVPVDLPPADQNASPPPPVEPVYISIQKDGSLFIGEDHADLGTVATVVDAHAKGDHEQRIFIRCDQKVVYGKLMDVMNRLQDAGYYKIGLVAEDVQS